MGGYLIGVHVYKVAKVLVCNRAVIALQKIVDDVFPVGFYIVGQSMTEGQLVNVWCPTQQFGF